MNVVLLPSAYSPAVGGVEELTRCLAQQLVGDGHNVEVWVNRYPAELAATETIEGIVTRRFMMVLPASNARSMLKFPPGAVRTLKGMAAAAHVFQPDVLHVHCFSVNGVYAAALAPMLRTRLIVSLHGETMADDHDIYRRSASLRLGLRFGLRTAAAVTGCSQFVLDDAVARFGLPTDSGVVVPNAVDVDAPVEPAAIELPFDRFVLAIGRVVENKGFDLLIDSFGMIAERHPDVGLLIGGDGAARPALQQQVRSAGLDGRVLLPGRFSRGNVLWATGNAHALIMPSRVEAFGIVVLEAWMAGLPVVVTTRGGAGEIVRDGVDGLVVDPFDRDALAAAINRLLIDGRMCEQFAAAGRERVRAFTWPQIADRFLELYSGMN